MHVREKRIGGQPCYEIVEEAERGTHTGYRVVFSLGNEAEPEAALRWRHANLLSLERSLQRFEPLRGADPKIARKCDTLNHRIEREKQKLFQLSEAIEFMAQTPEERDQTVAEPGTIGSLKLISNDPASEAPPDELDE